MAHAPFHSVVVDLDTAIGEEQFQATPIFGNVLTRNSLAISPVVRWCISVRRQTLRRPQVSEEERGGQDSRLSGVSHGRCLARVSALW